MSFTLRDVPALNAILNASSALFLLLGWVAIRGGRIERHRMWMLTAAATSTLFLVFYLAYHAKVGSVRFTGQGGARTVYFTILISHTTLAVTIVPLAILSVRNGLKMRVAQHRRVAKWTFPLWMYVSVTGVLVYFFLYQWFPSY